MLKTFKKYYSEKVFIRYVLIGFITYLIKVVITYILNNFFDFWYFSAYIFALLLVMILNFLVNIKLVFKSSINFLGLIKYIFTFIIFYFIDAVIVKISTDIYELYYVLSITLATVLVFIAKYYIYKYFVFIQRDISSVKNYEK
jgi:putative flippase GtrA